MFKKPVVLLPKPWFTFFLCDLLLMDYLLIEFYLDLCWWSFENFKFLGQLNPLLNVLEVEFALVFIQVAEGEVLVFVVPGTFSKGQLLVVGRTGYLLAGHSQAIAPATAVRSWEQFAGGVTGINDGLSWFSLEIAVGSVVDDLEVGRLARSGAADSGFALEPLGIGCVVPLTIAAADATGSGLVAEGGEIIDIIRGDVGAGSCAEGEGEEEWKQKCKFHLNKISKNEWMVDKAFWNYIIL